MSDRMAIHGIGLVGGFGCGLDDAGAAIANGGRPNCVQTTRTPTGERETPTYRAELDELWRFMPKSKVRRVNRMSRMAILGAALALEDAGASIPVDSDRVGVILATGYGASSSTFGFLDAIIDEGDEFASPTTFSNSVDCSAASNITILLKIHGACLTINQFEMSPIAALIAARGWLASKRVDTVVLGAVDEINDVLTYCRECFFGGGDRGAVEPLAFDRQTAIAGEGAAFLVLGRDEGAPGRYGWISQLQWTRTLDGGRPEVAYDGPLVLGADGHRICGRRYRDSFAPERICRSFADVYGSLPTGQAFDVALAALATQRGLLPHHLGCVKLDRNGNCAVIGLEGT